MRLKEKGDLTSIIISSTMPTTTGGLEQTDQMKLLDNGLTMVQVGSDLPWHAPV